MPKKLGDIQKNTARSMGDMVADFSRGMRVKDRRFENFWTFEPFDKYANEDKHLGFYASPKPVKFVSGSNRSGKTVHALFEAVMIFTGMIPPSLQGLYAHEDELKEISVGEKRRSRKVRIVVQSMNHYADTIKPLLTGESGYLPEAWSDWDSQTHMFTGPDGSYLEIMPIDPREKDQAKTASTLRGADLDHTMIDEITAFGAYTESRARPSAKQDGPRTITLSYCPQEGFGCWTFETLYKEVFEYKPDRDIRKSAEECHPEIFGLIVSMKDSPLISVEEYERQKRAYKSWEVAYRVDGRYSDPTSNWYFDPEVLIQWEQEERYSTGTPFILHEDTVDTDNGNFKGHIEKITQEMACRGGEYDEVRFPVWRIWEEPKHKQKYVIAADVAMGNATSDPHSVTVWNCTNQERPYEAAKLHMRLIKPGSLAVQAACMANVYGNCLLVPESNNTGGGMFIDRIRNYSNLYTRLKSDDRSVENESDRLGFFTSRHTKGPILDNAYRMIMRMANMSIMQENRDGVKQAMNWCPFNSRTTIIEFTGYEERIKRDKNDVARVEWGARAGGHDDTVMEAAIAWRVISHEYNKINACILEQDEVKVSQNKHYLGGKDEKPKRCFGNYKKQDSLRTLHKKLGAHRG